MNARFEELDWRPTPMGEISLRRRIEPTLQVDVYEVKLGDEFLMSSLFTAAEVALADISLARISGADLDVVVGGLGLGYTAQAVLKDARVSSLLVIEALDEVIEWH
jgi:spermidine synthase